MAEGPSLRTQVASLRSKDDLEAVFEHADGFPLIDQDDRAFIPELKRAEAALFPDDAPSTLRSLELVTRLDMVGRAVSQLSTRDPSGGGVRPGRRSISRDYQTIAAERVAGESVRYSSKDGSSRPPGVGGRDNR